VADGRGGFAHSSALLSQWHFATPANDLHVLEVGFTLPNISRMPRVRKIAADGKNVVIAVVGAAGDPQNVKPAVAERVGVKLEVPSAFLSMPDHRRTVSSL